MAKRIGLWLVFSLIFTIINQVNALEVTRNYEHYYINPVSIEDITNELRLKGPKKGDGKGSIVAQYRYAIDFLDKFSYRKISNQCLIEFEEPSLKGTILLYKLNPKVTYDQDIITAYEDRYQQSETHELVHERIYVEELRRLEQRIKHYLSEYEGNCRTARKEIHGMYFQTKRRLTQLNLKFDCESYGFDKNYRACDQFSRFAGISHQQTPSSTVANGENSDSAEPFSSNKIESPSLEDSGSTITYAKRRNNNDSKCNGQLIEPFKGTFYCVEERPAS